MNELVTICIPTYNRPALLKEAIASCLEQSYRPLELLVGDDSPDNASAEVIDRLAQDASIPLHYERNTRPLGQAGNINKLFDSARGDRIVLLHDDDLLLPDAVESLADCWLAHPNLTAAFGKQYILSASGEVKPQESENANRAFNRTSEHAGLQKSALVSALIQQFPNDGYMIRASVARQVRLREREEVGNATDFDFGLRVALASEGFYFLDKYVSKYRCLPDSVSHSGQTVEYTFPQVEKLLLPPDAEPARKVALKRMAPFYVTYLARHRRPADALRVLFSDNVDRRLRFSPKGLILLGQIAAPGVDSFLQSLRKRTKCGVAGQ